MVVVRVSHILGNIHVPAKSGDAEVEQSQEVLKPSTFHLEEVSWVLMERPDSSTVDGQALPSGEVCDSRDASREHCKPGSSWKIGLIQWLLNHNEGLECKSWATTVRAMQQWHKWTM